MSHLLSDPLQLSTRAVSGISAVAVASAPETDNARHRSSTEHNRPSNTGSAAAPAAPSNRDDDPTPVSAPRESPDSPGKLPRTSVALIMMPLCLSVFLSSVDLTIVTPAIPAIVSSFQSTAGYVWIGSAFVLANTAVTPIWGSVADIWGRKPIMLIAVVIFLGGSLLCALAPQMNALIAGRVVQGLGASGMGTMVNVIICDTFSLRDRGLYLAITSIVWAVGSAIGPVLGGVFTTQVK